MNVKRIVVDELPENCEFCIFKYQNSYGEYICLNNKLETIDIFEPRPDWCPLEVEEVCEWVHKFYDTYKSDCKESIVSESSYIYCPNCGKRIVYKESEE